MSAVAATAAAVTFPSAAWFERLAAEMKADRARHEHLGYIDCVAGFVVDDAGGARRFHVTFEEFEATDVREVGADQASQADFSLIASLATWREMIESIVAGNGRPDLEHTLNRLSHLATPMRLDAADPVKADLYFRYAQSLQEFFNAAARLPTAFD